MNQGFKRDMKEWAGTASIIHKPTGLFVWAAEQQLREQRHRRQGRAPGRPTVMMPGTSPAARQVLRGATIPAADTEDQDGSGGLSTPTTVSLLVLVRRRPTWCGMARSAGAFLGTPFKTGVRAPTRRNGHFAVDQAIDSAAARSRRRLQPIEPKIKLVTRDPSFSPPASRKTSDRSRRFDVFFMGGRIHIVIP